MTSIDDTYLARIVHDVRARIDSELALGAQLHDDAIRTSRSLVANVRARVQLDEVAIIGEVKRRSPSVGEIDGAVDPATQAAAYDDHGAAGISVLTELDHFGGSLHDLAAVRAAVAVPVLRKDFIVDARQLDVAAQVRADAVLLIAALHDDAALASLVDHAHLLGMEVLLEVHDERELDRALGTSADLIGINNRDLRTFHVDLATTERLAPRITDGRPIVAESGVRDVADASRMRACGVDALLVGEALMRAAQPGGMVRSLATAPHAAGAST